MDNGQVDHAERLALNNLDKWNDVTGVVTQHSGYYYELQSVITDAVHYGIQMALTGKVRLDIDGNIIKE